MFLTCFSALLYLNNEFEGGDFFFAHSTKDLSPDVSIHMYLNIDQGYWFHQHRLAQISPRFNHYMCVM